MRSRFLAPVLLALVALSCGGGGPDAGPGGDEEEISEEAERVVEAWRENAAGVAAYTAVEDRGGGERTQRYVKKVVDGIPKFVPEQSAGSADSTPDLIAFLRHARPAGGGEIEGVETRIFVVSDAEALRGALGEGAVTSIVPKRLEIHVGPDEMPRRMTLHGELTVEGETRPVTTEVTMTDWRTVDGFARPFRWTRRVEGMEALRRAALAEAMRSLEGQVEEMTPEQREAARDLLRRKMGTATGGTGEVVTVVKSLEVERE